MRQLFVFLGILAAIFFVYTSSLEVPPGRPTPLAASRIDRIQRGQPGDPVTAGGVRELAPERARPDASSGDGPFVGLIPIRRAPVVDADDDVEEPEAHTLRGRVVDERGTAVPDFRLVAQRTVPEEGGGWQDVDLGGFENGTFLLTGLPAGSRWRLRAQAEGYHGGREELVRIPARSELELELTRDAIVSGRVLDPHGNPIAGASVLHRASGRQTVLETDELGAFELGFAGGSFEVVASAASYAESEVHAGHLDPGEADRGAELVLREGGSLVGELLDQRGRPLGGWWIRARPSDGEGGRHAAQTDRAGRFLFERLAPGKYVVTALEDDGELPGDWPLRDLATIADGETTHLVLGGHRPDAILVRGRLTDGGEPAPGFRLWALGEGQDAFASGTFVETDHDGRFELGLPHSGPAVILAGMRVGGVAAPFHVQLSDEPVQDLELALPTGRIGGRVLENGESPRRRKIVRCVPEGRDPLTTQYLSQGLKTDDSGFFAFEGLPAGSYRLSVVGVIGPSSSHEHVRVGRGEWRDDVRLELTAAGAARVTVVDASGLPVQGATLYAHDEEGRAYGGGVHLVTNHEGQAELESLEPATFRFFARKDGLASKTCPAVTVRADHTSDVSIRLTPGCRMRVTVLDRGEPVRAFIRVLDETNRDFSGLVDPMELRRYFDEGFTTTERDVGVLPPGNYQVQALADDGREARVEAELEPESDTLVTVTLP